MLSRLFTTTCPMRAPALLNRPSSASTIILWIQCRLQDAPIKPIMSTQNRPYRAARPVKSPGSKRCERYLKHIATQTVKVTNRANGAWASVYRISRLLPKVQAIQVHQRRHCYSHLSACRGEIFLSPQLCMPKWVTYAKPCLSGGDLSSFWQDLI